MPYVRTRAGQVYYAAQGDGPPVVLLHANLHDHTDFDAVAGPLAGAGYHVLAVDWPGHGRSSMPAEPRTLSAVLLAGVLADLVAALDLPPAVLVGNSVGGYAAARLALDQPDRVTGLVLVNTAGFSKASKLICRMLGVPSVTRMMLPRLVPSYMRPDSARLEDVTTRVRARARTKEGAAVAAALWRSFAAPESDLRADGSRLGVPVLLVWGKRDVILPMAAARQAQAAIPGSELRVLDTGHVVFAARPAEFLAQVMPFLASVTTARQ
jgi:pimeloyl-ACP methyl ester carboxylesterase